MRGLLVDRHLEMAAFEFAWLLKSMSVRFIDMNIIHSLS